MMTNKRTQSRILRTSGSRSVIKLNNLPSAFRYIFWCLAQVLFKLWYLNPVSLILRRWRQLHHLNTRMALSIRPRLIDLITDFFLSDERRKRKLLHWVKSIMPWLGEEVIDFTACWQDGIVLCALMDSLSPGACPRFNLLKPHHRVNNCRLGIQLAVRYLHVNELPLSPEEMAIADDDSEVKICHLVQLIKWKYQKQGSKPTVFSSNSLDSAIMNKCQARGTGIKAGIVGKRTKFNILSDTVNSLHLQIEIRGPNNEYNKEKIISINAGTNLRNRHQVITAVTSPSEDDGKTKVIDDGAGHSFLRQKSMDDELGQLVIPFDYQCVGEGRFLVTYIPRNAGVHYITVLSGGVHIPGSPFEVKVSDWVSSWNLVPKSRVVPFDMQQPLENTQIGGLKSSNPMLRKLSHVAQVSKQLTRMKRRILRKVITANGEEIICEVTPTLSRQNSGDLAVPDSDKQRNDNTSPRPGESQNKDDNIDNKTSEDSMDTSITDRFIEISGKSTFLETDHNKSSLANKSDKSPRYSGSLFAAAVLAAKAAAAAASSVDSTTTNNNPSSAALPSTTGINSNLDVQVKNVSNKLKLQIGKFNKDEPATPEIIITPDVDVYVDAPRLFLSDNGHVNVLEDNEADSNRSLNNINSLGTQHDRESNSTFSSLSSIPDLPFNPIRHRSPEHDLVHGNLATTGSKNSDRDSVDSLNNSSVDTKSHPSRTTSPFLKVTDVVDSLLGNLKQKKQEQLVSPAHKHYMRSFSLDDYHQTFSNENIKGRISNNQISFKSSSPSKLELASNENNGYISQNELTSSSDFSSKISSNEKSYKHSQESITGSSLIGLSKCQPESSIRDIESAAHSTDQATNGRESNDCSHSVYDNKITDLYRIDDLSPCGDAYCLGGVHCKKEHTIKKKDLDERVYEVIEETSERDSLPHDEISETSQEESFSEDRKFEDVADFLNGAKLDGQFNPVTDVCPEMVAFNIRPGQMSSSFDMSDFHPKHKIVWSQHKSLSGDWGSNMFRADNLANKENVEITPNPFSNVSLVEHFNDEEIELLSSDSENSINGELSYKRNMERQKDNNVLANQFQTIRMNGNSGSSRRTSWSKSKSMSLPDQTENINDSQWKDGQNVSSPNTNMRSRRDRLHNMKKWSTFDVFNMDNGTAALTENTTRNKFNLTQKHILNEELDIEDDEVLQITIDQNGYLSNMTENRGNEVESRSPPTLSRDQTKDLSTVNAYESDISSDQTSSNPENDKEFNVIQGGRDDVMRVSPLSDASTKSENSDSSENENTQIRLSSTNQKSEHKEHLLKGDWSPQFIDLAFPGGVRSRNGSIIPAVGCPSPNLAHVSNIGTSSSIWNTVDSTTIIRENISNHLINQFKDKPTGSIQNGGMETKETQCEHSLQIFSGVENCTTASLSQNAASSLTHHRFNVPHTFSHRYISSQVPNYYHDIPQGSTSDFVEEIVSGPDIVYIKRRRKPVYAHDCSTNTCFCHASPNLQFDTKFENLSKNVRNLASSKSYSCHDGKYRSQTKSQFSDLTKINSFFSKLSLLSPDSADFSPVDNWSWLSNTTCVVDDDIYQLCDNIDDANTNIERFPSRVDYFRERTLTPTKYRVQQHNKSRNIKSKNRLPETLNVPSEEASNMRYSFRQDMNTDLLDTEENNAKLKFAESGSVKVEVSPGDRILTPTKYRRQINFYENVGTINSTERVRPSQQPFYTDFDYFNDERILESRSTTSNVHTNLGKTINKHDNYVQTHPGNSIEGSTLYCTDKNVCEFCSNKITPVSQRNNSQDVCPVCSNISRNTSTLLHDNRAVNKNKMKINPSNGNVDDRRHKHGNKEANDCKHWSRYKSCDSLDDFEREYDLKHYVKKRRKMIHTDAMTAEDGQNNSQIFINKNHDIDNNIMSVLKSVRDLDVVNTSQRYIDTGSKQMETQKQQRPFLHDYRGNNSRNPDYSSRSYQQTVQKDSVFSNSQNHFQTQQHHSNQILIDNRERDYTCNQTSKFHNHQYGEEYHQQNETLNLKHQQHRSHHDPHIVEQHHGQRHLQSQYEHDRKNHQHHQRQQSHSHQRQQHQRQHQHFQSKSSLGQAKNSRDNHEMVLRRQSTVDTLDSGIITEGSTHYSGHASGHDTIDSIFELENAFDFNVLLEP